jgi:hypothetical protein
MRYEDRENCPVLQALDNFSVLEKIVTLLTALGYGLVLVQQRPRQFWFCIGGSVLHPVKAVGRVRVSIGKYLWWRR